MSFQFVPGAAGKGAPTPHRGGVRGWRARRPAVVVFDGEGRDAFDQAAGTLRRRGVSVIKVVPDHSAGGPAPVFRRVNRAYRDATLYDRRLTLSRVAELGWRPGERASWPFDDVLAGEGTFAAAAREDVAAHALVASALACSRFAPHELLDKFEVNALLNGAGIRTPLQLLAATVDPRAAVQALGLPLVVKSAFGAAGVGVRIARSLGEVVQATAELAASACGRVFYQQYIEGDVVMYSVVWGPEGPLLEHALRRIEARWPLGPSAIARLEDDPAVLAAGRAVLTAIGSRGFADIGFVQDAQGECWHIDANLRAWGNMISQLELGADYAGAYVALLRGEAFHPEPSQPGRDLTVLPFGLYRAAARRGPRAVGRNLLQFCRMCARGPGPDYAVSVLGRFVLRLPLDRMEWKSALVLQRRLMTRLAGAARSLARASDGLAPDAHRAARPGDAEE